MCLSIPSKIIKIDEENNIATVDTMGVQKNASLDLIDEKVEIGDYVLLHIGFAMNKIDEENALESLKIYQQMVNEMEEEEKQRILREENKISVEQVKNV